MKYRAKFEKPDKAEGRLWKEEVTGKKSSIGRANFAWTKKYIEQRKPTGARVWIEVYSFDHDGQRRDTMLFDADKLGEAKKHAESLVASGKASSARIEGRFGWNYESKEHIVEDFGSYEAEIVLPKFKSASEALAWAAENGQTVRTESMQGIVARGEPKKIDSRGWLVQNRGDAIPYALVELELRGKSQILWKIDRSSEKKRLILFVYKHTNVSDKQIVNGQHRVMLVGRAADVVKRSSYTNVLLEDLDLTELQALAELYEGHVMPPKTPRPRRQPRTPQEMAVAEAKLTLPLTPNLTPHINKGVVVGKTKEGKFLISTAPGEFAEQRGTLIGPYFAVHRVERKFVTGSDDYVLTHVPTGLRVLSTNEKKQAITIGDRLNRELGEKLNPPGIDHKFPYTFQPLTDTIRPFMNWAREVAHSSDTGDVEARRRSNLARSVVLRPRTGPVFAWKKAGKGLYSGHGEKLSPTYVVDKKLDGWEVRVGEDGRMPDDVLARGLSTAAKGKAVAEKHVLLSREERDQAVQREAQLHRLATGGSRARYTEEEKLAAEIADLEVDLRTAIRDHGSDPSWQDYVREVEEKLRVLRNKTKPKSFAGARLTPRREGMRQGGAFKDVDVLNESSNVKRVLRHAHGEKVSTPGYTSASDRLILLGWMNHSDGEITPIGHDAYDRLVTYEGKGKNAKLFAGAKLSPRDGGRFRLGGSPKKITKRGQMQPGGAQIAEWEALAEQIPKDLYRSRELELELQRRIYRKEKPSVYSILPSFDEKVERLKQIEKERGGAKLPLDADRGPSMRSHADEVKKILAAFEKALADIAKKKVDEAHSFQAKSAAGMREVSPPKTLAVGKYKAATTTTEKKRAKKQKRRSLGAGGTKLARKLGKKRADKKAKCVPHEEGCALVHEYWRRKVKAKGGKKKVESKLAKAMKRRARSEKR